MNIFCLFLKSKEGLILFWTPSFKVGWLVFSRSVQSEILESLVLGSRRARCAELGKGWVMQDWVSCAEKFGFHTKGSRESQEDFKQDSNIRFALWKDHSGCSRVEGFKS